MIKDQVTAARDKDLSSHLAGLALYRMERAHQAIASMDIHKETWSLEDTAAFDCMHYEGNLALIHAAKQLNLKQGEHLLDLGSGYGATGRYLHTHYGVKVTGVELQQAMHAMAELINAKNAIDADVKSVHGDFLSMPVTTYLHAKVDAIISLLCILHIADRRALFARTRQALKSQGTMYIEDYYARRPLVANDRKRLHETLACSFLPSDLSYRQHLEEAGFEVLQMVDVTSSWTNFVQERADSYIKHHPATTPLASFYKAVAALFAEGAVGGLQITCRAL